MANELAIDYGDTGLTDLYAVVYNATNQACLVASGAFENINNSNSDLYDVALTEQGSSSIYLGSMPGSVAAGVYRYSVYQKNSSVADLQGDERVSYNETIQWSGTAEIPLSDTDANVDVIIAKLPSKSYLTGTANSDGDIEMNDSTGDFNSTQQARINSECDTSLTDIGLDHLVSSSVSGSDVTDNSIIAQLTSKSATADWDSFDNTTDALEAIRDRGDAAWSTAGSLSDILNVQVLIPNSIDLANTSTVRISLGLTNMLDDLPTTSEITPGTISIDRKAIGGTSWASIVSDAACSEATGLIYYDEVFDSGTGYAEGDSIRVTFKNQKITVAANDYEITGSDGWIVQTYVRESMRGTDSAALATVCTETRLAELDSGNMPSDIDSILADTGTDGVAISTATQQSISDETLKRGVSNVEDTADTTSLAAVILSMLESSITGATWTIRKTGGSTFVTKTVTTDSGANPVVGVT